jgi:hypothetical protein
MTTDAKDGPWVVVIGDLFDGFDMFGPFETWDAANEWADAEPDVAGFFRLGKPEKTAA